MLKALHSSVPTSVIIASFSVSLLLLSFHPKEISSLNPQNGKIANNFVQESGRIISPELQAALEDYINTTFLVGDPRFGLGLTIVQLGDQPEGSDKVFYTNGFGLASLETGTKNTNSTQFMIGSITKSFTAQLVVKALHEKFPELGEAALDTPIRTLIPWVNFTMSDRYRSERVSFRDLLSHKTCIFPNELQSLAGKFETMEEVLYRTRYNQEFCPFRQIISYDNQMFTMAGYLASQLLNMTFEDALTLYLFQELKMLNTSILSESDDFPQMPHRASPHYLDRLGEPHPFSIDLTKRILVGKPAGGIFATPDDMSRYIRFQLGMGKLEGEQLFPEELIQWTRKASAVGITPSRYKAEDGDITSISTGYGLGLMLRALDGWEVVEHRGTAVPYANHFSLFPGKMLGIYSGTNVAPLWELGEGAGNHVVLHFFIAQLLSTGNGPLAKERALRYAEQLKRKEDAERKAKEEKRRKYLESLARPQRGNVRQGGILGYYGSGSLGDLEIVKKFNERTNLTEVYLEYGKFYRGWLRPDVDSKGEEFGIKEVEVYKIEWDTVLYQEALAIGVPEDSDGYLLLDEDQIHIVPSIGVYDYVGSFQRDLRSENLPEVPWAPDSC